MKRMVITGRGHPENTPVDEHHQSQRPDYAEDGVDGGADDDVGFFVFSGVGKGVVKPNFSADIIWFISNCIMKIRRK